MNFTIAHLHRFSRTKFIGLFAVCFLFASTAMAFIPSSRTIINRVTKGAGKGVYVVEQEVSFRTATDPIVLRERWLVESADAMRVTISSQKGAQDPFRYEIIYRDGKRWAPESGQIKVGSLPSEFVEGLFYARNIKSFADVLIRGKVLPPSFFQERQRTTITSSGVRYDPDASVRLARFGGSVNYFFGLPTPAQSQKLNPGVWIEQDGFIIRKVRLPTQSEIVADKYLTSAGLRLPRERVFNWENSSVGVRVISVKSSSESSASSINPNSISANDLKTQKLPETSQVQEFYKRFR